MAVDNDSLTARLAQSFPEDHIEISGDGYHFEALIVSTRFAGKRPVARQQLVYAAVNDWLASGELHALSMRCHTPEEWSATNS